MTRRAYPPLPREVRGLAGPIRIDRPIKVDARDALGEWRHEERRILVRSTLKRQPAWKVLMHELCHAAIDDAGITIPLHKEEAMAEAIASAFMTAWADFI